MDKYACKSFYYNYFMTFYNFFYNLNFLQVDVLISNYKMKKDR